MGQKLKIAGWISIGAVAGALTTVQLQAVARGGLSPLPLEELQQLAAVFGMVKTDYVEPVDEKKLITDAIPGTVASPVTIVREEIRTQSVRSKVLEPGYAWIRLSQFQERTVDDFATRLEQIYKQEPHLKGLVLDLRNDPGGLLDAAVAVSAAFLPENVTVVSTNGQLEESKFTYKAAPEFYQRRNGADPLKRLQDVTKGALKTVPLVVLVNEGSASASEIVAGALQDHKRGVIMGNQTFGKGSVQTVRPLGPDTGLKLTTARYYTPSGKSIQARGIVPDVMVDESEEGNVFSVLRTREADLDKHLGTGQGPEAKDPAREKAREEA